MLLYYTILYYIKTYYTILYYFILYCTILYYIISYYITLYYISYIYTYTYTYTYIHIHIHLHICIGTGYDIRYDIAAHLLTGMHPQEYGFTNTNWYVTSQNERWADLDSEKMGVE